MGNKNLQQKNKLIVHLFSDSMKELLLNDPLRMAGATAFFTTFALPPILVILIQVLRLVLDAQTIRSQLFKNLSDILGPEAVNQVADILGALRQIAQNWYIIIGGFIFLLFVASTLFKVIRSSINQIWKIRPLHKLSFVRNVKSRIQSIAIILVAGLLLVIGIVAEALQAFIGRYVLEISPLLSAYFNTVLNYVFSVLIVMLWFTILFRYLPDGRPKWRVAFAGALVTALLFTIGKIILHWLLSYSNLNTVYGTSASIVLLLLFVFYNALILYFGAAFTKIWGQHQGDPIRPLHHAMHYRIIESEIQATKADY